MALQAWFPDEVSHVEPGEPYPLLLTVENASSVTRTCTVTPAGMNANWVTVSQPGLMLSGGMRQVVEVWVRVGRVHSSTAGRHEVSVRLQSIEDDQLAVTVDATIVVAEFVDRTVDLVHPVRRARRSTVFEGLVTNRGNAKATCEVSFHDAAGNLDGYVDPPVVGVLPGDSAVVRLHVKIGGWLRTRERNIPFEVDASQANRPTATADAVVLQTPTLSIGSAWKVGRWVLAAALVAAGWVLWVRPSIDDRIDRAVQDRVAETAAGSASATPAQPGAQPQPSTDADADADPDVDPEPIVVRLAPDAPAGASASTPFTAPGDRDVHITDIVLQNPNRDLGIAVLSNANGELYRWDLGAMSNINEFQPRVTPLPVPAGSELVFEVQCAEVGAASANCGVALLLTGELAP